jgi:hypothetical protein
MKKHILILLVFSINYCFSQTLLFEMMKVNKFNCKDSIQVVHLISNGVAPVDKTTWYKIDTSNLTGSNKCWITQNLGATNQAASATDTTEASRGWYWQHDRKQGYKHDGTTRTPATTWITTVLRTTSWSYANDPCNIELKGWRLPTSNEWVNANANGGWGNYTNAYNSKLKLNAAGELSDNGSLTNIGVVGRYQSNNATSTNFRALSITSSSSVNLSSIGKAYAMTIRCIKDNFTVK